MTSPEPLPILVEQTVADELNAIARDLGVELNTQGECGFGRPCVGLLKGSGYVNYHPLDSATYQPIDLPGVQDPFLVPVHAPDAYHKHDCFAVLARDYNYAEAGRQLLAWLRHLESLGQLELVSYPTGAAGLQAVFSGTTGYCLRFKQRPEAAVRPPDYVPDAEGDADKRLLAQARLKDQLRPLIAEMLKDAGRDGVTPHAIRFAAEARGWVTGKESGRYLSFLAGMLRSAGAVPNGYVKSKHKSRRGAVTCVWVLKDFAE